MFSQYANIAGDHAFYASGRLTNDQLMEVRSWCLDNIGPEGQSSLYDGDWGWYDGDAKTCFVMRSETTAAAFKLRWWK